jgi:hypothetical protein
MTRNDGFAAVTGFVAGLIDSLYGFFDFIKPEIKGQFLFLTFDDLHTIVVSALCAFTGLSINRIFQKIFPKNDK